MEDYMETINQERKKHHHSGEDHSDEDFYYYDDNYGRPNQMCCPYMNNCPCMNQQINRKQDEPIDNNSNSVNAGDFRRPGFSGYGYQNYGYSHQGYGYPGYGFGYPGYGFGYPGYGYSGYGHGWNGHYGG